MERFINILIIDDNVRNRKGLKEILSGGGNNVLQAESIVEALEILKRQDVGIMLVNIDNPNFGGIELLQTTKEIENVKNIYKIIITSDSFSGAKMVKGLNEGAVDYISTPFNPNLIKAKIEVFKSFKLKVDLTLLKPLMPFAIFSFLVLALQKIDSLMLEKLALNGAVETGIYGAAYRFLEAATMLPILFATFFYPLMVNVIAQQKKFNHLVNNGLKLLGAFSIVIALATWFYQTELITLFYGNQQHQNLDLVFGLLMFTVFFQSVYYVYSSVFTANNNLKLLCYISLAGLGVNIIANIILIPLYSAVGAAISNLLGFGVMALIYVISYHIKFNFKIAYSIWFKFLVLILTLCTSRLFLDQLSLNWILHLLLFLTVGLFTAFLLKLLIIKDFS